MTESLNLQQLIAHWDGMAVVSRYDADTAAWIFIALHDDTLGRPTGGTRMKVYDRPEDGLLDAMRLAAGMTHKWAAIDIGFGGGKAVLALSRPLESAERQRLLERYARILNLLDGSFSTGEDLGTSPEDMLFLSRTTRHVHGCNPSTDEARDPGPFTALGVFAGIRSAVARVFGSPELAGRSVLIEGVGHVGRPLARHCADAGASLILADVDESRAEALAGELGGTTVRPELVYDTACDVYAPCAVGATLNEKTIPRLACRIVAGSANNQLAEGQDADRLHQRGILYAPDYLINAGGATAFGLMAKGETDEAVLVRRVEALGQALSEVFEEAARRDESPVHASHRRVLRVLEEGQAV